MDKANLPWNVRQIEKNMKSGKASFPDDIQRGLVWTKRQKSLLIHSLLIDYPVPPIYATEEKTDSEDGKETTIYSFIDGKQRLNTIYDFVSGGFTLLGIPAVTLEDKTEIDINGLTFKELPVELQEEIASRSLTVFYYKNATLQEKREMFARLNNGKVLTPIERLKAQAPNYVQIRELGDHQLFELVLSGNDRNKFIDDAIVMRTYLLVRKNEYDMSEGAVKPFISDMHFEKEDIDRMNNIFDVLFAALADIKSNKNTKKIFTKAKNRTHILSMVSLVNTILDGNDGDKDKTEDQLKAWVTHFYDLEAEGKTINAEFNKLCGAGSSQPQNVKRRIEIVQEDFDSMK
jgi:hypothetical protein